MVMSLSCVGHGLWFFMSWTALNGWVERHLAQTQHQFRHVPANGCQLRSTPQSVLQILDQSLPAWKAVKVSTMLEPKKGQEKTPRRIHPRGKQSIQRTWSLTSSYQRPRFNTPVWISGHQLLRKRPGPTNQVDMSSLWTFEEKHLKKKKHEKPTRRDGLRLFKVPV